MNAITNIKQAMAPLAMTLGTVLVAASMTTNTAKASDIGEFTSQARARVLAEATTQPGPAARVEQLRGALQGVRVVDLDNPYANQREQALAAIRSQQLDAFHERALDQIDQSVTGARIVKRMPAGERRTDEAIAVVRAEQLEAMRRQATSQLAISMAHAHVVESVAWAQSGE